MWCLQYNDRSARCQAQITCSSCQAALAYVFSIKKDNIYCFFNIVRSAKKKPIGDSKKSYLSAFFGIFLVTDVV